MIKVVKPGFKLLSCLDAPSILTHIERCGRTCYQSQDRITPTSAAQFVRMLRKSGHESVLEHASLSVLIQCSRACSHQIVRHRLNSFSQASQRYVKVIRPKLVFESVEDVIEAYLKGLSCARIASISSNKYSEWDVYQILRRNKIARRNHGVRGLIYSDFFDTIDTPEKAYLVGLILADGNVSRGDQLTITQHSSIIWYIAKMFREFMYPGLNVHKDNGNCSRVEIHSKPIVESLNKIGIIPNKTYAMQPEDSKKLWDAIPVSFKADFLRGFLDGDGSVGFKMQKNGTTKAHYLQWLGHRHTLEFIKSWANEIGGVTKADIHPVSGTNCLCRYQISSPDVVEKLSRTMYANFQYPFGNPIKASLTISQYNIDANIYSSEDGMEVILPNSFLQKPALWRFYAQMERAASEYSDLLLEGLPAEDARSCLPNAVKTEIAMTANLRQWRSIFKERALNPRAQLEVREIMQSILRLFALELPSVFEDQLETLDAIN